jgi:DNA-binding transcriptional MerR regulator
MTSTFTVGDFSRMTHLSVKTLRHYHDVGLLEPVEVNAQSGYRYYAREQVPTAQVIRRLRDLEMPVADVKAVLAAPDVDGRNALIAAHLDRLHQQLDRTQSAVDALRSLLGDPTSPHQVQRRSVAASPAVAISATVERADISSWWQGALGELFATVQTLDLQATGPAGGMYGDGIYQDDRGEATVFIPVDGAARAVGRVEPHELAAVELAVMVHDGSLDDVDVTYGALGSYVAAHEIGVDGPLREYYVVGAHESSDPTQWRTEIGWPIFRADSR